MTRARWAVAGFVVALGAALVFALTQASAHPCDNPENQNDPRCAGYTTTTTSTTTTTIPPIPPTEPYPANGLNASGGYTFITDNVNVQFEDWWEADYWGANSLPYTEGAQWVNGDRSGYRCGYGFLDYEGVLVGRFTFVRVEDASVGPHDPNPVGYGRVIDQDMEEGVRYYDGTLAPPGSPQELGDCPETDIDYSESFTGPDERPRIAFWTPLGWQPLDIRDYNNTVAHPLIKFRLFSVVAERVTVVAYRHDTVEDVWSPVMVVYYDSLNGGHVTAELEE